MLKRISNLVGAFLLVFPLFVVPGEARADAKKAYTADWGSLKKHNEAPDWFRDAKFGIYFHWGVYSVPAFGTEWYPRNMHVKKRREYKHHLEQYGDPSKFGYHDFIPMFRAEKFDADEWADLFVRAGARFAGPVAEHHDGFSMWASKLTPFNAKDMGPKRDILGELAKAIRSRGMKLITTFHHAHNQGYYPLVEGWPTTDPPYRKLYGNMPREQFLETWKGKLLEVIDHYQPDIMWFDSWLDEIPDSHKTAYLAYYFNRAHEWKRDVVVVYKQQDLPREVGVEDYEKGRTDRLTDYTWLTDDTISRGSWCHTKDLKIKSTREVLHVLIDIVSKNGQLLLNISPKADGTIPENQKQVLVGIGDWLKEYGEAIYGTRPLVVFGEGPTRLKKGGHFVKMKEGYKPADIRYTTKGNTIYAIQLGWPGPRHETVLRSFSKQAPAGDVKVNKVSLLGSAEKIIWAMRDDGLAVTTPSTTPPHETAVVYKIETDAPASTGATR